MPLLRHPTSRAKVVNVTPGRARILRERGYTDVESLAHGVATSAAALIRKDIDDMGRPGENDRKAAWVAFAEQVNIDVEGLTKAEIIKAIDQADGAA